MRRRGMVGVPRSLWSYAMQNGITYSRREIVIDMYDIFGEVEIGMLPFLESFWKFWRNRCGKKKKTN